jgi:hypothetical protein
MHCNFSHNVASQTSGKRPGAWNRTQIATLRGTRPQLLEDTVQENNMLRSKHTSTARGYAQMDETHLYIDRAYANTVNLENPKH